MEPLNNEQIFEFLRKRSADAFRCSFCGHGEYALNAVVTMDENEKENYAARFTLEALAPSSGKTLKGNHPFYSVVCTNCGNTYFFHENQIRQWLKANAENAGEEEPDGK